MTYIKKIACVVALFSLAFMISFFTVSADSEEEFTFSNPVLLNPYNFSFSWKDGYGNEAGPTSISQTSDGLEVVFKNVSASAGRTVNFTGTSDDLFLQGGYLYRFQWRVYHDNTAFTSMTSPVLSVFGTDGVNQNLQVIFGGQVEQYGGTYYNYHSYFWVPENVGLSLELNFTMKITTTTGYFYVFMYHPTRLSITDIATQSNSKLLEQIIASQESGQNQMEDFLGNGDGTPLAPDHNEDLDNAGQQMEDLENEALGGKSDEQIQQEVDQALDFEMGSLDQDAQQGISGFFDGLLDVFGPDYQALLMLALSLGLAAFIIGRRYKTG